MEETKRILRSEKAVKYDYTIQSALDEEVVINEYLYLQKEYDERGNLLKEISYDEAGGIMEHFTYRYDNENRRIEVRSYMDDEEVAETTVYEYVNDEQPITAKRVYADGSSDMVAYRYDDEGRLIGKRILDEEGDEEESELWRYEGALEVWYEKKEWGEPVFTEAQEYNAEGKVTRITLWESDTGRTTVSTVYYDPEGRRNRIERYDDRNRLIQVMEIRSFEHGEPLEMVVTGTGGSQRITRYTYDGGGRVLLQQEYDPEGNLLNEVARGYTEEGYSATTEVKADRRGEGMNQHYRIEYTYEYR